MTQIIGFAGRKGSGKNTACNWIISQGLVATGMVSYAKLNEQGNIVVPVNNKGEIVEGVLDCFNLDVQKYFADTGFDKYIKLYSLADPLKQLCIDLLGLPRSAVYGSNEEKDAPTKYRGEDFVRVIGKRPLSKITNEYLSGRQILQLVGTEIFRKLNDNVWVDALIRRIKNDAPDIALVCDVRFENEVEGIKADSGKVIKLTRSPFEDDQHASENALNNFPAELFDYVLDNSAMSIPQQNEAINNILNEFHINVWNWTCK